MSVDRADDGWRDGGCWGLDLSAPAVPTYEPITFSLHQVDDATGTYRVRIDHAPARSHITTSLLIEAMEGRVRCITVTGDTDDILTITDDYGQRFIYRLGTYEALYDAFEIEWPD